MIATHSYTAEDEDELAFEKGEIIHVVPFDDPDEQVTSPFLSIKTCFPLQLP